VHQLPRAWRSKGLLIDSNILALFVVGSLDTNLIKRHKRTDKFSIGDYRLLDDLLRLFKRHVTTPNVLTEVSNIVSQIGGETGTKLRVMLGTLIEVFDEQYAPSTEASKVEEFRRLGLTDAVLLLLARGDLLVLTDDRHLYSALEGKGLAAINFNHVRDQAWG
jgi:hypothetical protein